MGVSIPSLILIESTESMICIMGMDDGHGYDGQQKDTICDI